MPDRETAFALALAALLCCSTARAEDEIPANAFLVPLDALQENTLEMCQDSVDNDNDRHVDCDDQDCEIFAICVKPEEEPAAAQPVEAAPVAEEPPAPREPTRVVVPPGYRLADTRGMTILKGIAIATFFPGLLIGGITGGVMLADGGNKCTGNNPELCRSGFAIFGGILFVTGVATGTAYVVKRNRRQKAYDSFALAPIVGDDVMGVGGVFVF